MAAPAAQSATTSTSAAPAPADSNRRAPPPTAAALAPTPIRPPVDRCASATSSARATTIKAMPRAVMASIPSYRCSSHPQAYRPPGPAPSGNSQPGTDGLHQEVSGSIPVGSTRPEASQPGCAIVVRIRHSSQVRAAVEAWVSTPLGLKLPLCGKPELVVQGETPGPGGATSRASRWQARQARE